MANVDTNTLFYDITDLISQKKPPHSDSRFSDPDIISFFMGKILVLIGGRVFQQLAFLW